MFINWKCKRARAFAFIFISWFATYLCR